MAPKRMLTDQAKENSSPEEVVRSSKRSRTAPETDDTTLAIMKPSIGEQETDEQSAILPIKRRGGKRRKATQKEEPPVTVAFEKVHNLVRHATLPAQGGGCRIETRRGLPNGTGWSQRFHELRQEVEKTLPAVPAKLRRKLQADMTLLKIPEEGGRFNSKSKWLYLDPLLRIEEDIRGFAEGKNLKASSKLPRRRCGDELNGRVIRALHGRKGGDALRKAQQLLKLCQQTAQGGSNALETRAGKPNGTGFSARFHQMRLEIEWSLTGAPAPLQKEAMPHLRMMKPKSEGGRFDSKSRWIYMEPLNALLKVLEQSK